MEDHIAIDDDVEITLLNTIQAYAQELARNQLPVILMVKSRLVVQGPEGTQYVSDGLMVAQHKYVLSFITHAPGQERQHRIVFLTNLERGHASTLGLQKTRIREVTITNHPILINYGVATVLNPVPDNAVPMELQIVIVCDYVEIVEVMSTATIPPITRVLSALLFAFPYIRDHLIDRARVITFEAADMYRDMLNNTRENIRTTPNAHRYSVLLNLHLLAPSHTTDHKTMAQLTRRMASAYASEQMTMPSMADVTNIVQPVMWKPRDMTPLVYGAIGHALSIKGDFEYDQLCTSAMLLPVQTIALRMGAGSVNLCLVTQLRLVYDRVQATSLKCWAFWFRCHGKEDPDAGWRIRTRLGSV